MATGIGLNQILLTQFSWLTPTTPPWKNYDSIVVIIIVIVVVITHL